MDRILGGIYVGSVQPIIDHTPLKSQYNITHVLSIIKFKVLPEYLVRKSYALKNVPIDDSDTVDILQYINECNRFIDQCLYPNEPEYDPRKVNFKKIPQSGNAVFIHCHAGMSRSVTFAVSYLMYRFGLSLTTALHAVKRKRPQAQPNDNFMDQLGIFEKMGGQYVDDNHILYKQWKLKNAVKINPDSTEILTTNDELFTNNENCIVTPNNMQEDMSLIRCKKCRQRLALSSSFIKHEPPSEESSESHFIRRAAGSRRVVDIEKSQDQCSHYFVEPLNWMKEELQGKQQLEGKFNCPNCESKIGGYNWKGSRCSCGKWMVPAIHLLAAKVDKVPAKGKILTNAVNFTGETKNANV
ncbi:probable Tyrosine-protein phosphatase YVH1 [Saccharomycodes ludwigii]|uniref:protein-tyrosine-phosphatase n=1 Tax=Saccharomycodes ludwigii TaxID=36035 RepID=A0A376B202_9ASCO|nr:hypothetical protein SCDLUD_003074 [Saccharomycodes ludwigii]KAH3900107.1 hypothetical protein SCDLUD_003074 [Saccharomycodes ludwigii]SSD58716.1 probable Tyrosine-protein phosphatase YVH1 [Saccharomycodes ludwigii]